MTPNVNKANAENDRDLEDFVMRGTKFLQDAPDAREQAINSGDMEEAQKIQNAIDSMNQTMGMIRYHSFNSRRGPAYETPAFHHDVRSDGGKFSERGSQGHFLGYLARMGKAVDKPVGVGRPGLNLIPSKKNPMVRRWQGQPKIKLGFHQQLVDAKKERPLTGAGSQHIAQVIPGARHHPYEKLPGLDKMHERMGIAKPGPDTDFKKYQEARDRAFESHPQRRVPLKDLTYTQNRINRKQAEDFNIAGSKASEHRNKPVQVLKHEGKHYLMNGHHRVAAQHLAGQEDTNAHVMDLDESKEPEVSTARESWDIPDHEIAKQVDAHMETAKKLIAAKGLNDHFAELRDRLRNGKQSKAEHVEADGQTYTQARQRLHNNIIKGYLQDKPSQKNPEVVFMGGMPGSGKSSLVAMHKFDNYVHIDSDKIKEKLGSAGWNAALYQDEATDLVEQIADQAKQGRKNILLDVTLKSPEQYIQGVQDLKKIGYKAKLMFADLPPEKAMERAINRYMEERRFVDPHYIATHDGKNRKSYEKLKRLMDSYAAYNNDVPRGEDPHLIEKHEGEAQKSVKKDDREDQNTGSDDEEKKYDFIPSDDDDEMLKRFFKIKGDGNGVKTLSK